MFDTLLESRAVRQRHTASSVASVILHSAIITGAAFASAREITRPVPARHFFPVTVWQPEPATPPVGVTRPIPVDGAALRLPTIPRFAVPTIVPVGIPSIDISRPVTVPDTFVSPIRTAGIICKRDCPTSAMVDSAGRALLSGRELAMRLVETPVPPRYPESLRRAGIEGEVIVRFLVDTTGRVDLASVEVQRSTHEAFTTAVRESLARLRFAPPVIGERKVGALAVMPFRFTLR